MKPFMPIALSALALSLLSGCQSGKSDKTTDHPLTRPQIERALAHSRPPQQFGLSVYAVKGGVTFGGQGRLHPNHFAAADMIREGVPVIGMRGRAKRDTLNALIDVSSPVSWMEFSAAQDFKIFYMDANGDKIPYRGTYNTGGIPAFAGIITQMRIENVFIENIPFYVRMAKESLGPLARGIEDPPIDAVMGYDNLKAFEYVQFNLRDDTVSFSATTPYTPMRDTPPDAALIIDVPGHGLAVEGIIDGKAVPIMLDPAGDFSLTRGDVKVSSTRKLQVGDLEFSEVPTLLLPTHQSPPRVGRDLLTPYLITICNNEGLVYFEKLPEN